MAGAEKMRINLMVSSGRDAQIYDAIKDQPPGARARQLKYLAYLGTLVASGKMAAGSLAVQPVPAVQAMPAGTLGVSERAAVASQDAVVRHSPAASAESALQEEVPAQPAAPDAVVFDLDDVEVNMELLS